MCVCVHACAHVMCDRALYTCLVAKAFNLERIDSFYRGNYIWLDIAQTTTFQQVCSPREFYICTNLQDLTTCITMMLHSLSLIVSMTGYITRGLHI